MVDFYEANFEIRGYVEIFLSPLATRPTKARVLLTPEQRATFYRNLDSDDPKLDRITYNLPTAKGQALYTLINNNETEESDN